MSDDRLADHLDHIRQAATDACAFVERLSKDDFAADKRPQQAAVMSLIVIGEAAARVMDHYRDFARSQTTVPWRDMRGMPATT